MAEGNPRETLLKYDDPVESGAIEEPLSGPRSTQKEVFCNNAAMIKR